MTRPTILVTAAGGRTGMALSNILLDQGFPVRAVVHRLDHRSEALAARGAQITIADLFNADEMTAALRGTQRAYFCAPFHPFMLDAAASFATAARRNRLEAVTILGQWLASASHPALATRQTWLADQVFDMLPGMAVSRVNPGFFASSPYLRLLRYAAQLGVFPMPVSPHGQNAPPSDQDIAAVAAACLTDPARHAGQTYRPTGPALLTVPDMTRIIGEVLGHRVRHLQIPLWMFLKAARLDGTEPALLAAMPYYFADHDAGAFALGAPTTHVQDVTGRSPEDFATIVRRHAATPQARRSLGRMAAALADFMSVPLRPGMDARAYIAGLGAAEPATPLPAMANPDWLAGHTPIPRVSTAAILHAAA